jgi:hypothetical protein
MRWEIKISTKKNNIKKTKKKKKETKLHISEPHPCGLVTFKLSGSLSFFFLLLHAMP